MNIMVLVSAARVIVPWWLPPRGLLSGGRGLLSEGLVCDSSLCDDRCDRWRQRQLHVWSAWK